MDKSSLAYVIAAAVGAIATRFFGFMTKHDSRLWEVIGQLQGKVEALEKELAWAKQSRHALANENQALRFRETWLERVLEDICKRMNLDLPVGFEAMRQPPVEVDRPVEPKGAA